MQLILTVGHLVLALALIGLILIQHGKGADAGAAFGSGASATVFGARGSASFLTRATAVMAVLFFLTSMTLAYYAARIGEPAGLMDGVEAPPVPLAESSVADMPVSDVPSASPVVGVEVERTVRTMPSPDIPDAAIPEIDTPEVATPEIDTPEVDVPADAVPAESDVPGQ